MRGLDANFSEYLQHRRSVGDDRRQRPDDQRLRRPRRPQADRARSPACRSVRVYQGRLPGRRQRRLWIIAGPPRDDPPIPASQLIEGSSQAPRGCCARAAGRRSPPASPANATSRVGSVVLAADAVRARRACASRRSRPTSAGRRARSIINAADYRRYWRTSAARGAGGRRSRRASASRRQARGRARARRTGRDSACRRLRERAAQYAADSRQGLDALSEISTLLLIAAALAVAAALSAAHLAAPRAARVAEDPGLRHAASCGGRCCSRARSCSASAASLGALAGVYGHALASRWLRLSTGFPAPFAIGLGAGCCSLSRCSRPSRSP